MRATLAVSMLGVGTGLYILFPPVAFVMPLLGAWALLLYRPFRQRPLSYLEIKLVTGVFIYNIFFMCHSVFYSFELKVYFAHWVSLGMFALTYALAKGVLDRTAARHLSGRSLVVYFSIACLAILLAGQYAEIRGYIDVWGISRSNGDDSIFLRPGGFLNPNFTASVALVHLFIVATLRKGRGVSLAIAAVLACLIVGLSQSRAAFLALACVVIVHLFRSGPAAFLRHFAMVIVVGGLLATQFIEEIGPLIGAVTTRFEGDESSDERAMLVEFGISAFSDAPFLGNGFMYGNRSIGASTHNEIIEALANFGAIGALFVMVAFMLMYLPCSVYFAIICIAPAFVFSHNFFATIPFQASLGVALAASRMAIGRYEMLDVVTTKCSANVVEKRDPVSSS